MKRIILLPAVICLPILCFAAKQPKRVFSTVTPPYAVGQWHNGDLINLSNGGDSKGIEYFAETDGEKTFFRGRGAGRSDEGKWLAVYPAPAVRQWTGSNVHFVIPHEQIAGRMNGPVYSAEEDLSMKFKPLTAYFRITLASDIPPVKELRVSSNKYISGNYKADLNMKKVSVLLDEGELFRDIVLKGEDGGVMAPGDYTMAVFARILPDGISVEIVFEDGRTLVREFSGKLSLVVGKTRDLGVITNRSLEDNLVRVGDYPKTEAGRILKSNLCPSIVDVVWDTTYSVANGLDYYKLEVVTESQDKIDLFLLRADPSKGLDVRVAWSDKCTPTKWVRQIPAEMAAHMDSPSKPVYAIVNADFCENRPPIRPRGPMHCDGKILIGTYSVDPRFKQQALSYVGVTHDGKMTIGANAEYELAKKSLKECTGAGVILVKDSEIEGGYVASNPTRDPRTALGYTSENIVWILAADGRHKGTEGMTYMEMADIFRSLGCSDAVNLDGGGSTQMLVRNPGTGIIELLNTPSDPTIGFGGRERPRLNGWVVMRK